MIARLFFLAVLAFSLPVRAQVTAAGPMVTQMGSSYVVSYASNGTPIAAAARSITATGGEALIRDMFNVAGPAGTLPVTVSRTATAAGVALGLARVASKLATPLTVGMLAYDLLSGVGVRQGAGGAEIDSGEPSSTRSVTTYTVNSQSGSNSASACSSAAAAETPNMYSVPNPNGTGYIFTRGYLKGRIFDIPGYNTYCYVDSYDSTGKLAQERFRTFTVNSSTVQNVPFCIEAATGSVTSPRADGKCPTGRYESVSEAQVEAKVLPVAQARTVDAVKAAIAAGAAIPSTPPVVEGPATQVGPPRSTTTTGPAGQTSVTTTSTYQYNYAGDTITYNTTNNTITNVTAPDGTTTTETKTEDQPKPADTKQLCDAYPDSLACMKPGTPPDAEQIPIDRRPVTITKDPRWAANAGACTRGAIQLTSGVSINLWQPFCDFFALIRGVVVGMFGLAGAFIFRNGVK